MRKGGPGRFVLRANVCRPIVGPGPTCRYIEGRSSHLALSGWFRLLVLPALASAALSHADGQMLAQKTVQLRVIEVHEPEGQILSYRHLAGSTEVHMRGTQLAPSAQVKLKI